ncbi:MAG: hypothetical protein JO316_02970 [Abitibacteriaceae bacterium]|nr:hypothetical protein [Abditibacteriaceae bacterium]MBV9864292.1 hypothetical protein [Abditibacteriaceae bacterium]
MDTELTHNLAKLLSGGGWMFHILAFIFAFLGSIAGGYFGAYGNKRGELRAIQDDFEKVKSQLQETTRLTTAIQTEITKGVWVEQQRWELRRDLYTALLKNLSEAKYTLSQVIKAETREFKGSDEERDNFTNDMLERNRIASQEIENLIHHTGVLFLSSEALETINTFLNAEKLRIKQLEDSGADYAEISAEATSWSLHLDNEIRAAYIAYDEIVNVAKADLQING